MINIKPSAKVDTPQPAALAPKSLAEQKTLYLFLFVSCLVAGLLLPILCLWPWQLVLGLFLGIILILIALHNYRLGFFLLFALAPLPKIGALKSLFGGVVLLSWLGTKTLRQKKSLSELFSHPLNLNILFFILAGIVTVVASSDIKFSGLYFLRLAGNLVFIVVFADLLKEKSTAFIILHMLLAASVLEVLIALVEFLLNYAAALPQLYRCRASFVHANYFGRYLSYSCLAALALRFCKPQHAKKYYTLIAFMLMGILLSGSRASVLGLLIGLGFFIPMYFKLKISTAINLCLALVVIAGNLAILTNSWIKAHQPPQENLHYASEYLLADFQEGATARLYSKLGRQSMWTGSMKMFLDRPWTGHGFGMITSASENYVEITDVDSYLLNEVQQSFKSEGRIVPLAIPHSHNMMLNAMVAMGFSAVIFILWFYSVIFYQGYANLKLPLNPDRHIMILLGLTVVIVDVIIGLVEPTCIFEPGAFGLLFGFFASLTFNTGLPVKNSPTVGLATETGGR